MDFFYKKEKKIDTFKILDFWYWLSTKFKRTKHKFWNLKINFCEVIIKVKIHSHTYFFIMILLQKETNCYYCCCCFCCCWFYWFFLLMFWGCCCSCCCCLLLLLLVDFDLFTFRLFARIFGSCLILIFFPAKFKILVVHTGFSKHLVIMVEICIGHIRRRFLGIERGIFSGQKS